MSESTVMGPTALEDATPDLADRENERLDIARRVIQHRPFNGTCLRRALIIGHILRSHDPRLHVGVTKKDGTVKAHAWLWIDGYSLDPDADVAFHALTPATSHRSAQ